MVCLEPVPSCGDDFGGVVPDELDEEEVVDNPWTTIGNEVFRTALYPKIIFDETWFSTTAPLVWKSVIHEKFAKR